MKIVLKNFKELGRELCPVCGHSDRCKANQNRDVILCFRCSASEVNGFRRIKQNGECATFVLTGSKADRTDPLGNASSSTTSNLDIVAAKYTAALTDDCVCKLAAQLGVSVESLRAIRTGWDEGCAMFPERDAKGNVIGIVRRRPDGTKMVGAGQKRGLTTPQNLSELPDPVLIDEGATDVAACLTMGLTAVGRPNNAGGRDLLAALLRDREVVVIGENDIQKNGDWPGRKGALLVVRSLATAWHKPVAWALPPADAKDVRNYLIDRADRDAKEIGRELLEHFRSNSEHVTPSVGSGRPVTGSSPNTWAAPQPLPDALPSVAPFSFDLLPEAFRGWIEDIAGRAQCPPDFAGVGAMVCLAAIVGRKVTIRPKRRDDWTVVPNLWGSIIGRSGLLKTPMLEETIRPSKRLEVDAKIRYEEEVRRANARLMVAQVRHKEAETKIRKAIRAGEDAETIAENALAAEERSESPVRRRYLLNDCTVEKLGEILNDNLNGVLLFRDELIGFWRSLEREGHESARAFYLEAWNGTGRFTYDRIGRGTIDIESTTVSILGGIQPSVLHQYIRSSLREIGDDGFLQRFQLAVWPDVVQVWRNVDEWPDTAAKNRAYAVFQRMDALDATAVESQRDGHGDGLPFLRFDGAAQDMFDQWRGQLERRLRSDELHPLLESHFAKYRSLVPSLALLIHLADGGIGPIGTAPLRKAIAWGEYLETHARRTYHVAVNPDLGAAQSLANRIVKGDLSDGFALRDVYRHEWTSLSNRDDAKRATEVLCDLDWISSTREDTGGAPRTRFWINPKVHETFGTRPDKTDKSPQSDLVSVLSVPLGRVTSDSEPVGASVPLFETTNSSEHRGDELGQVIDVWTA